ncbi:MAG TPA: hypothetical protein VD767_07200 [Thermomicrobiales bacterium]|nr:hypothetical protein [Thermomicrobiales bacterium]
MHPVISDIDISIRQYERDLEHQVIRRDGFARESARIAGRVGLVTRMTQAVRRFVDPRGFALDQALRIGSTADPRTTVPAITSPAPVSDFPIALNQADTSWREAA